MKWTFSILVAVIVVAAAVTVAGQFSASTPAVAQPNGN